MQTKLKYITLLLLFLLKKEIKLVSVLVIFVFYLSGKVINFKNDLKFLLFHRYFMSSWFQFKFLWNSMGMAKFIQPLLRKKVLSAVSRIWNPKVNWNWSWVRLSLVNMVQWSVTNVQNSHLCCSNICLDDMHLYYKQKHSMLTILNKRHFS